MVSEQQKRPTTLIKEPPKDLESFNPFILTNPLEVSQILAEVNKFNLYPTIVEQFTKLTKGTSKAFADAALQRETNDQIIITEFNKQKRQKGKFWGLGRIIDTDVIRKREEEEKEKAFREL